MTDYCWNHMQRVDGRLTTSSSQRYKWNQFDKFWVLNTVNCKAEQIVLVVFDGTYWYHKYFEYNVCISKTIEIHLVINITIQGWRSPIIILLWSWQRLSFSTHATQEMLTRLWKKCRWLFSKFPPNLGSLFCTIISFVCADNSTK